MRLDFIELAGFRGFRDSERFDIPEGFAVVTGRNGVGKSTLLDAVEFALTGTLSKYPVEHAKGGGLAAHIWWMGDSPAPEHRVTVGFKDNIGRRLEVSRDADDIVAIWSPEGDDFLSPSELLEWFGVTDELGRDALKLLAKTSIIRDEQIAAMSLDLPGQARFAAVKDAIGVIAGPDFSARTEAVLSEAKILLGTAKAKSLELQAELGRALTDLTNARSEAERSSDLADATRVLERFGVVSESGASIVTAARDTLANERARIRRLQAGVEIARGSAAEWGAMVEPGYNEELDKALQSAKQASAAAKSAQEVLALALRNDATLRAQDQDDSNWAALLKHGSDIGLVEGHCPLCDAARGADEFAAALNRIRARLAGRGSALEASAATLADARQAATAASVIETEARLTWEALQERADRAKRALDEVQEIFNRDNAKAAPADFARVEVDLSLSEIGVAELERAIFVLEASGAHDRIVMLERRVSDLRQQIDDAEADIVRREKAQNSARLIDQAAKTVANEILVEQFDTVMPLLKELYQRLRPHTDWTEIDSDFGGKVRASLNFTVGEGRNPQFLFSSGQRRAAGLAFLLAIHLSRPWCKLQTLLLDDPVQHVDDYRALNLVEVLSAIRRSGRQVIVAVEDDALAEVLCRRLRSSVSEPGCRFDLAVGAGGASIVRSVRPVTPMPPNVLNLPLAS